MESSSLGSVFAAGCWGVHAAKASKVDNGKLKKNERFSLKVAVV